MKNLVKTVLWLLLAASLLVSCTQSGSSSANQATGKTVLNIAGDGEIPTADSTNTGNTISSGVLYYVQEGLVRLDPDGNPTPGVAESWEVDETGTIYTFHLREDAYWENGVPVVADDFIFSWQRLADPTFAAVSANQLVLSGIVNSEAILAGELPVTDLGIAAPDEHTIVITLVQPNTYFLKEVGSTIFYPLNREFVTGLGDLYATDAEKHLSNGPFTFEEWDGTGLSWSYVKNEYYWDKDSIYLTQINVEVIKDQGTKVSLYEAGELDSISITGDYFAQYKDDPGLVQVPSLSASNVEIGIAHDQNNFEATANGALVNVNIRKALFYAVDREELITYILEGQGTPAVGIIADGIANNPGTGASIGEDTGNQVYFDGDLAREYWEKGLAELGVTSITLELLTSDSDSAKKVGEYLQNQWQEELPGLIIDYVPVVTSVRFERMMNFDFDLALGGWSGGFDPLSYIEQHNITSAHNHSQYVNPVFNDLVAKIKSEGNDAQARWDDIIAAQQILLDEAVEIPLYSGVSNILVASNLHNVYFRSIGGVTVDYTYAYFSGE